MALLHRKPQNWNAYYKTGQEKVKVIPDAQTGKFRHVWDLSYVKLIGLYYNNKNDNVNRNIKVLIINVIINLDVLKVLLKLTITLTLFELRNFLTFSNFSLFYATEKKTTAIKVFK
jgi:hypothetical protein